jgi:hypothetical protein
MTDGSAERHESLGRSPKAYIVTNNDDARDLLLYVPT